MLDINAWKCMNMQLIAFALPPISLNHDWWRKVSGQEPEDFASTKRKSFREDRGTYAGATLSLVTDVAKIAWMAAPASQLEDVPEGVPILGPFPERRDWFKNLMTPWLAADCPPITRLGFACHLVQFAEERKACYGLLGKCLPTVKLNYDDDWGDFSYRINRRKASTSGVPGLKINRLSTWDELTYRVAPVRGNVGDEANQRGAKKSTRARRPWTSTRCRSTRRNCRTTCCRACSANSSKWPAKLP